MKKNHERATVENGIRALTKTNIMPKALAADLAKVKASRQSLQPVSPSIVIEAVHAALSAGRNPFEDADVKSAAVLLTLQKTLDIGSVVDEWAVHQRGAAVETHASEIFDAIAERSTAAGQVLADSAATLGDVDIEDAQGAIRRGDKTTNAWRDAQQAIATLNLLDSAWMAAMNIVATPTPRTRLLRLSPDVDYRDGDTSAHGGKIPPDGATIWHLVARHHLTIAHPTRDEWRKRLKTMHAASDKRSKGKTIREKFPDGGGILMPSPGGNSMATAGSVKAVLKD